MKGGNIVRVGPYILVFIQDLVGLVDEYRKPTKQKDASPISEPAGTRNTKQRNDLDSLVDEYRKELQTSNGELTKQKDASPISEPAGTRNTKGRTHSELSKFSMHTNKSSKASAENKALLTKFEGQPYNTEVVPISTLENVRLEIQNLEKMLRLATPNHAGPCSTMLPLEIVTARSEIWVLSFCMRKADAMPSIGLMGRSNLRRFSKLRSENWKLQRDQNLR
ncbi:MAG: hypothetical protein M1830_007311 [Pleopsidium flavum]|nr:MAG: hypothetical protein M1830_007311 [Pleopsidium flavum]